MWPDNTNNYVKQYEYESPLVKYRKFIFMVVGGLLALLILLWVANHGRLNVRVENAGNGTISYALTTEGKQVNDKDKGASANWLLAKGKYGILATQGESSAFTTQTVKGFLGTSSSTLHLQKERARTFVGYNPSACTNYTGAVLLSYECSGNFDSLALHTTASTSTPTYKYSLSSLAASESDSIVGTTTTALGDLFFTSKPPFGDVSDIGTNKQLNYSVQLIKTDGTFGNKIPLQSLQNSSASYTQQAYKSGFLMYDVQLRNAYYYQNLSSAPKHLSLDGPHDHSLSPVSFSIFQAKILAYFGGETGTEPSKDIPKKSEFVLYDNGNSKHFTINDTFVKAQLCADTKLCLLTPDHSLVVYDISGAQPKVLYSLPGVTGIYNTAGGFIAVTDTGIINLDVDNGSGYSEFSFGSYKYCDNGIYPSANGYVLCVQDGSKQTALYIDQSAEDSDNIDKKIKQLENLSQVSDVSINHNYIYVSTNTRLIFDPSTNLHKTDPEQLRDNQSAVNAEIDKLGIDSSAYTIVIL
jgi:hypothetical protein